MTNRFRRAGGALAFGALFAVGAAVGASAQSKPTENTLLGVTLLKSSYRDVLKHFGRPDEIQAGGPFMPEEAGAPAAGGAQGQMGGMMGGMSGGQGGPGASGKKATSKTGFPGKSGTGASGPGMAGGQSGMTPPGMYGGGQGQMAGGLPGFSGSGGMMLGGGGSGQGSPSMGGGLPGSGSPGAPDAAAADQPEYEATWWYHDKKNGLHKSFLFNKDGRVIQVQEYGYDKLRKGSRTRLGVGLGSGLNQVLRSYGWSNDAANDGRNIIMRFGGEDKVAFQLVNNVVVGITIAVVKDVPPVEPQ